MTGNIQLDEEMDFNPRTEAQNCLAESEARVRDESAEDRRKIAEAVAAGKFVAVANIAQYCRATDAACGTSPMIVKVADTYDEASAALADWDREDVYPEVRCKPELHPRYQPPQPPVQYSDDDIPF